MQIHTRLRFLRGFTLIELLIALAIFSILAAITLFSFRRFAPTYKLSRETEKVVQNLRLAQQKTVTEQIIYLVRFDLAGKRNYEIIRLNPDPENPGGYLPETIQTETLDSDIEIRELRDLSNPEIQFTTAGGVVDAGQIDLANRYDEVKTIDVHPAGFINY